MGFCESWFIGFSYVPLISKKYLSILIFKVFPNLLGLEMRVILDPVPKSLFINIEISLALLEFDIFSN